MAAKNGEKSKKCFCFLLAFGLTRERRGRERLAGCIFKVPLTGKIKVND